MLLLIYAMIGMTIWKLYTVYTEIIVGQVVYTQKSLFYTGHIYSEIIF